MTIAGIVETKDFQAGLPDATQCGGAWTEEHEHPCLVLLIASQGETYNTVIVGPQAKALNFLISEGDRIHVDGLISKLICYDLDDTVTCIGFDIDPVRIQFPLAKQMSDWFPIHQGIPVRVDPEWANQPPIR
jgi:hypothetical protein